jgi:hypothetical protein
MILAYLRGPRRLWWRSQACPAVSTCQVLLAGIGPYWLTATDQDGRRRLEDPDDIVRMEIGAALVRDIRVIPILVAGVQMPRRHELSGHSGPSTAERLDPGTHSSWLRPRDERQLGSDRTGLGEHIDAGV